MRILNIVNRLAPGGIELLLLRAIPYLKSEGIEVDICCLGPPHSLDQYFAQLGCTIWRIPKSANIYRAAKNLNRVLDQTDYTVIHSHLGYTSGGYVLASSRHGIPSVVSIHSCEPTTLFRWRSTPVLGKFRTLWLRWHRRVMERHADLFLGHSQTNLISFRRDSDLDGSRLQAIANGIEFPEDRQAASSAINDFLPKDGSHPVILHVGSFKEEKNHLGLLDIFGAVLEREPSALLILVGDGRLRKLIESKIQSMDISGSVCLVGVQENVWPYLFLADVLVFPSVSEGFGNTLVESELACLPLVASDIPAHREAVAPAQHRFLFSPGDYAGAASLVLEQLEASRMGKNPWVLQSASYARSHFSMLRYSTDLAGIYREIAGALDANRTG